MTNRQRPEHPVASSDNRLWGSDVIADMLRALGLRHIALNPGASYRGLHDSLVNRLGNDDPQMLLCLHEESAVALAHGFAKVTGEPMAAIVHSNVGLMHASMAVFNAWCDRAPLLLLGATGPVDAARRRPWIDWIHTSKDQGALVRNYTKWDDQPASVPAAVESLLRAWQITASAPHGPTYICLDAAIQESQIETAPVMPDMARFRPVPPPGPDAATADRACALLRSASRPVLVFGRMSRREEDWSRRVELAERLGARVLTDLKLAGTFPTDHELHAAPAGTFATPAMCEVLREADVIVAFDCVDLAGTLKSAFGEKDVPAKVINVSLDRHLHNGWSMDYQGLPPVDLWISAAPDPTVTALVAKMQDRPRRNKSRGTRKVARDFSGQASLTVPQLAQIVSEGLGQRLTCLVRHPLSWAGDLWEIKHPLDFLGADGGGGIGSGPGTSVGAALALRGSGRIPLAVLGDGDFLMGVTALWTAVHYGIPLIIVVANNRSYYNDEIHQERVAKTRGRPVENKWIGQHMRGPDVDLAMMARGQGATGLGPVYKADELARAFEEGIAAYDRGEVVVIDSRVEPGYDAAMTGALSKSSERS